MIHKSRKNWLSGVKGMRVLSLLHKAVVGRKAHVISKGISEIGGLSIKVDGRDRTDIGLPWPERAGSK
jgi:hypothetical protein